jgi:hypothetical protein
MATTAERLAEARDAYHKLLLGDKRVDLTVGDHRFTYTAANVAELRRYIGELEAALAIENGQRPQPRRRRIVFGGG